MYGGTNVNIYYLEGCICSLSPTSTYCNTSDIVTLHNFSFSCSALVSKWGTSGWNGMSMFGVLMTLEAVISSSRNRGIPSVTFISPRPAKWNVLRVIWVDGSPIDWQKNYHKTDKQFIIQYYSKSYMVQIICIFKTICPNHSAQTLSIIWYPVLNNDYFINPNISSNQNLLPHSMGSLTVIYIT